MKNAAAGAGLPFGLEENVRMDVSELVPIAKCLTLLCAAGVVTYVAGRVRHRFAGIAVRALGAISLLIGSALVLVQTLTLAACTRTSPGIASPDGSHVAIVTVFQQGALGEDSARVSVRARWSRNARTAYEGQGGWDTQHDRPAAPNVRWLDNRRLQVRYIGDRLGIGPGDDPNPCQKFVGEIEIVCVNEDP